MTSFGVGSGLQDMSLRSGVHGLRSQVWGSGYWAEALGFGARNKVEGLGS